MMTSILIDSLFTTSSPSPSNSRDPVTQAVHTLWESGDQAGFSVRLSPEYVTGSDLYVMLDESTASPGAAHSWKITVTLNRQIDGGAATFTETSTHDCLSPGVPNSRVKRRLAATGAVSAGTVDNYAILPGDDLTFVLTRSAPVEDDDPLEIRVINIHVEYETAQATLSDCSGRIGLIIEAVRDLFNEPEADFLTDSFILRSMNRCQQDIAADGYWRTGTWIPCVSGRDVIHLPDVIPDYVDVYRVAYGPQRRELRQLNSVRRFMSLKSLLDIPGTPEYFLAQNNNLMIIPTPTQTLSHGFLVYHSYCPPHISCSQDVAQPDIPKSFDQIFVYFSLAQAFLKDRAAPGADVKFHEYTALYQNLKNRLLSTMPHAARLSPPWR